MRSRLIVLGALLALVAPLEATAEVSVGYAFLKYLEEGGGSAPLGFYLTASGTGAMTLALDLAYHRDSEDVLGETITLNTYTALAGPRFRLSDGPIVPFLQLLGGVRHDRIEGESNTAFGGMAGAGIDLKASEALGIRLGADFQLFRDEGENLESLRLSVGFVF